MSIENKSSASSPKGIKPAGPARARKTFSLDQMISILMDAGDLIPVGESHFEDMGGHIISERDVPSYFDYHMKSLRDDERAELIRGLSFEAWLDQNYDAISKAWHEHLSEKQDSREHITRLANSDRAFEEFAQGLYDEAGK